MISLKTGIIIITNYQKQEILYYLFVEFQGVFLRLEAYAFSADRYSLSVLALTFPIYHGTQESLLPATNKISSNLIFIYFKPAVFYILIRTLKRLPRMCPISKVSDIHSIKKLVKHCHEFCCGLCITSTCQSESLTNWFTKNLYIQSIHVGHIRLTCA